MIYKGGNYSIGKQSIISPNNGDVFERSNFSQAIPHTSIFPGISGLTFRQCNLVNCDVPADAVVESCNTSQVSRCFHLHPDFGLLEEEDNCEHVVDTDTITIDGQVVDIIYHRKDKDI